ncbi:hypothetical protein SUGI_1080110 [Cryptomeria japonica]|nr:hypothetical protein SUGI_1080110 [Cryptomeria japonica]
MFLSFRGKDVRMSLVDHLFRALSEARLQVFLDSHKLKRGEKIWLGLERAIESSAIRIPIFSQGYADSARCLKEAAEMLKTPGLISPLFYDVDPFEVRYPMKDSSLYKKSILEPGGFEALVKTVVKDVIETLDRVPLQVAKHPVGLDRVKKALIQKLNLNSAGSVVKAEIWGMGGIGKTTIAKAVYNEIYADFHAASFVFNVRSTATEAMGLATGLTRMQKKILKDLSKYGGEVDSVDEGISLLTPGSRVIITSRNQHILNDAGVSSECIQLISGLEINEGLKLFSWHAFLRESPSPGYENLFKGIVEACKGHSLSLEVIGSFLYDKQNDPDCWTEALHNITKHPTIHKILCISYSALQLLPVPLHRLPLLMPLRLIAECDGGDGA